MRDARKDAIEMAARRERLLEAGFRLMSARTIEAVTLRIPVSEPRLFVNLLYTMLSVAGKYAEGLVYPPDGERDMTDELEAIKRMILDSLTDGRRL